MSSHISLKTLSEKISTNKFDCSCIQEVYHIVQTTNPEDLSTTVKYILSSQPVQLHKSKKRKFTILHNTINTLSACHVQMLLKCGHPVNILSKKNESTLLLAVRSGSLEKVKAILPLCSKKTLTLENSRGEFPFLLAIKTNETIAQYFLEFSSDILDFIPEKRIYNTLKLLMQFRSTRVNQMVLSQFKNLSSFNDEWGRTLLFWAQKYHKNNLTTELQNAQVKEPFVFSIAYNNFINLLTLFTPRYIDHFKLGKVKEKGCWTHCTIPVLKYFWDDYVIRVLTESKYIETKKLPQLEFYSKISDALLNAAMEIDSLSMCNNYKKELPVIIPTGWVGHSVVVTLYKNICTISNRGDPGIKQKSKLQVHQITQECVTSTLIQQIFDCNEYSREKSSQFLYSELLQKLSAKETKFCTSIQQQLKISDQNHPNCSVTSPKLSVFGLLLSEFQHLKTLSNEQYNILHDCYKSFSEYTRVEIANIMSQYVDDKLSFFFESKLKL